MWRLIIIPLILSAVFVRVILNGIFAEADEFAHSVCLVSVENSIATAIGTERELLNRIGITGKWRTLDDIEERLVIERVLGNGNKLNCSVLRDTPNGEAFVGDKGWINVIEKEKQPIFVRVEFKNGPPRRF